MKFIDVLLKYNVNMSTTVLPSMYCKLELCFICYDIGFKCVCIPQVFIVVSGTAVKSQCYDNCETHTPTHTVVLSSFNCLRRDTTGRLHVI